MTVRTFISTFACLVAFTISPPVTWSADIAGDDQEADLLAPEISPIDLVRLQMIDGPPRPTINLADHYVPLEPVVVDDRIPPHMGPNELVEWDPQTNRAKTIPMMGGISGGSSDLMPGGLPGASILSNESEGMPKVLAGTSMVTAPWNYPWSANCKIYFQRGGSSYVASGTLIDSRHVITAGHVVHGGAGSTWSTNMVVVPAYDNGTQPFGIANATNMWSWTAWTNSGDYSHDVGFVRLDRPVGALTGWYGYGYNNDCSFFTSSTWNQAGYPAAGPFDGEQMWFRSGPYEGCVSTTQAYSNNASYGGSSGTGSYTFLSNARYVHGVHSGTNNSNTVSYTARIDSNKFSFIQSTIQSAATAATDLIPMDVNVDSPAGAGSPLQGLNYLVHNYSNSTFSGTVSVQVVLSGDDYISPYDVLLQTHSFTSNIAARGSTRITVTNPPTLPSNLPPGSYYIGVILNISDANTGNNATLYWDAAALDVCAAPTAPDSLTATKGTFGAKVKLRWNSIGGATAYEVWRKRKSPGYPYEFVALTYSPKFNDTTGQACMQYNYRIKARGACGTSGYSTLVTGWRGSCNSSQ